MPLGHLSRSTLAFQADCNASRHVLTRDNKHYLLAFVKPTPGLSAATDTILIASGAIAVRTKGLNSTIGDWRRELASGELEVAA